MASTIGVAEVTVIVTDGSAGPAHEATQPKITDYPLPKLVKCQVGTTCQIPMLVTAGPNKNIQ
jgi:hypothetical protein